MHDPMFRAPSIPIRRGTAPTGPGSKGWALVALVLFLAGASVPGFSAPAPAAWRADRVLVQPRPGLGAADLEALHRRQGARVHREFPRFGGLQTVELPAGTSVEAALQSYRQSDLVEIAEPDYLIRLSTVPDDPSVTDGTLWYLRPGANSDTGTPTLGSIDAPAGWDIAHDATNIIVAVVDSGIRYTHEDLAANIWDNPAETAGNGVDDDRDGYVDDVHGINALTGSGDPLDDVGHGTHVAGIIGAIGNNLRGGSGIAWKVRLMACKFIGTSGEGSSSDAIECLDYARSKGAHVINCSWGNTTASTILRNAFQRLRDAGIVVAAAAGNEARNTDVAAEYPAGFALDNIVSVVATTADDGLADFSNYGAKTTDVGAPGVSIRSTWYTADDAYSTQSGTSMATPIVSGMLALLRARFPAETPALWIDRLVRSADPRSALAGRCVSGGRVNLRRALADSVYASFTASSLQGSPPLTVQFTNTSRGPVVSQRWSFGDGSTSTEVSPEHVFGSEGNFRVDLAVFDSSGLASTNTQTISVIGNYAIAADTYAWIDPGALDTIPLTDNGVSAAIPLPFAFPFYGRIYDSLSVGANGILGFQSDGLTTTANTTLPATTTPNAVICPYWDNLNPAAGGSVRAGIVGSAPSRKFVASWIGVPLNQGGAKLTFQAILEEDGGRIRFEYQQVQPQNNRAGGRGATVGIENETGWIAARYLFNGSPITLTNQQALVFEPRFQSGLRVSPATRAEAVGPVGGPFGPTAVVYTLANAGSAPLRWQAAADAAWLDLEPTSGTLSAGQSTVVTASLAPLAGELAAGDYVGTVDFVNEANGLGNATREFVLHVASAAVEVRLLITGTESPVLELQGPAGRTCVIQSSTDLVDWQSLTTVVLPEEGFAPVPEVTADAGFHFFRAVVLP